MHHHRSTVWMLALCLGTFTSAILPASADPPGEQLIDKVTQAYQNIQQYDATLRFQMRQTQGRWTMTQQCDYFVAMDRPANRLIIDTPDQLLVADGQTLFYKTPKMPGKHLATPLDDTPLNCAWIIEQVPTMVYPMAPIDFAFLLSDDPLAFVSKDAAGAPVTLPPDENDPQNRPRIQSALQAGMMTLTINPTTYLIDKVVIEMDTAAMGAPAGTQMAYIFDIDINSTNQPLDPDRFAFDTNGSKASPSIQHMMASGSNAPHPLTDQPVPPLKLPDIDGNEHDIATDDADAKVIILDFWATWCPPCVAELPELQEVYDWAKDNNKPVAIYAVNQGETTEQVKQFWQKHNLSIPVLMDENFITAEPFMINGIPQTVIISDGKVQQVHVGYAPGIGEQIKAEIQELLDNSSP
jgi:thiol-disulfide isomerase/thioredoxin/outer membrane lipoprotein-sorting protein